MEYFDPQILNMVLILPALFGLSLLYEGVYKRGEEESSWLLNIISGILVIIIVVVLFFVFRWL